MSFTHACDSGIVGELCAAAAGYDVGVSKPGVFGAGGDLPAAMRAVGLDPGLLRRPGEQIDFAAFCELSERCAASWGFPTSP